MKKLSRAIFLIFHLILSIVTTVAFWLRNHAYRLFPFDQRHVCPLCEQLKPISNRNQEIHLIRTMAVRHHRVNGILFAESVLLILCTWTMTAQNSPHGALVQQCTDCHTTEGWTKLADPMKFDHATTSFRLVGQHRSVTCKSCHTDLKFAGTVRMCVSCHLKDYNAAVTIGHRSAGFSTDCEQCHLTSAASWQSSFDHNRTQFQTRGAHEGVACNTCHVDNRFRGIPIDCIACHQRDYANAQQPNHLAAGFSTACATCHRALTWQPAVFYPHPWFPISKSDTHSPGRWNACTDCHASEPNYTLFECINCHEHSKTRTDANHSEVRGYVYESSACYHCHSSGTRGG